MFDTVQHSTPLHLSKALAGLIGNHTRGPASGSMLRPPLPSRRQQMVYKAIWLELQDAVHAVDAMTTKTPAEAGS